jgi:hypothetical protein
MLIRLSYRPGWPARESYCNTHFDRCAHMTVRNNRAAAVG